MMTFICKYNTFYLNQLIFTIVLSQLFINININKPWELKASFSRAASVVIGVLYPSVHRLVYTVIFAEYNIDITLRFLLNFWYVYLIFNNGEIFFKYFYNSLSDKRNILTNYLFLCQHFWSIISVLCLNEYFISCYLVWFFYSSGLLHSLSAGTMSDPDLPLAQCINT